jgi:hypothetical protein
MTGYDATHAEGFIRLFGLPLAAAARRGRPELAAGVEPSENGTPAPDGNATPAAAPGATLSEVHHAG